MAYWVNEVLVFLSSIVQLWNESEMILIFSRTNDYSTFEVIKWLNHFGVLDVFRINSDEDNDIVFDVRDDYFVLRVNGTRIALNEVGAAWYRKGSNWLGGQFGTVHIDSHPKLTAYLNHMASKESNKLSDYVHYLIEQTVPVLGSAFKSDLNKLVTLHLARAVGLKTPECLVLNERQSIMPLLEDDGSAYITKAMSDGVYLFDSEDKETGYFTYTESLRKDNVEDYPERIPPSFIQREVEKQYEVRAFFLDGRFYSWAIFSQADAQTSTDYRRYNDEKPNRVVPYLIPDNVEKKLCELFHRIDLNTGSVDLMVDSEDEYYFLEINPVGQFGSLSKLTNYQLEAEIARWLINHGKRG